MNHLDAVLTDLHAIRQQRPLVLNVTNYVVANTTANALLALGASPAMTHNPQDLEELVALASALVVNIGTPTEEFLIGADTAGRVSAAAGVPSVLDPVAAGATTIRTQAAMNYLVKHKPSVVRANASEIMALAGEGGAPHGVDSSQSAHAALDGASVLAQRHGCVVCVSGSVDYITDGNEVLLVEGGSDLMPMVTGMGCTSTALVGAFLAVNPAPLAATAHAMAVMSACGEIAREKAAGPGTLQLHFYDALYALDRGSLAAKLSLRNG